MEKICIGEIVNTHGLKGEVKIKNLSGFASQRFKKGNTVYVQYQNELISLVVSSFRMQQNTILAVFKDYEDINLVEKFKHCFVYFDKDKIPPLKNGEYYYFQLKGLQVKDQSEHLIGTVIDIEETGANNCLRIKGKEKEILVPYVPSFISKVDLDEGVILINVIEGLL